MKVKLSLKRPKIVTLIINVMAMDIKVQPVAFPIGRYTL